MSLMLRSILTLLCSITLGLSLHEYYAVDTGSYIAESHTDTSFQDEESFDVLQHHVDLLSIEPEEISPLFPILIHDSWQPYCCQIVAIPADGRLPLRGPPAVI